MSARPLVLVPGACLGGWAWREVAVRLRRFGHDVFPVTLTGLGERVHLASRDVDLETHIADVLGLLDYEDLRDAVLVGHSYAGVVVTGAADRRPERLNAVVYLDCSPLPTGMAIADAQPPEQRDMQRAAVERDGDGWRWPVPDRATLARGLFGSTTGLEDRHFAAIEQRGTPQPYATFTTPLRLAHARPPGVRRAGIFCTEVASPSPRSGRCSSRATRAPPCSRTRTGTCESWRRATGRCSPAPSRWPRRWTRSPAELR